ncbi:hypothetical protein PAECIP111893_04222 [Paenibacillus plantiphilus]|uniref:DUF4183 domain-containing protein n=1 Tax=Paenibacillus plantiphilus TaxID=2905650 RepID=A0ABM9CLM6_9BACL|nr:DUF4183 domain-containing protein [Paenibacillus plantiphilus]CAH1216988.1 hypothetical protein PAECIP111893_04222 [Paenibacillus plantiphilus]
MPVIKPVYTAVSTAPVATGGVITTSVNPVVSRYFAAITAGMIGATVTTIPAASFVDDADDPITVLPALTADDYANVYINGVLQQSALSTLSTTDLVLAAIDISVGVPVLLEIASFSNTTSDLTTPPTISAPTITIFT